MTKNLCRLRNIFAFNILSSSRQSFHETSLMFELLTLNILFKTAASKATQLMSKTFSNDPNILRLPRKKMNNNLIYSGRVNAIYQKHIFWKASEICINYVSVEISFSIFYCFSSGEFDLPQIFARITKARRKLSRTNSICEIAWMEVSCVLGKLPAEKYLSIQISHPQTVVENRMCAVHKDVKILRRC